MSWVLCKAESPVDEVSYLFYMDIIERNIDQIILLCERIKVRELYVFGSVLTDKFNDESDIDFLVEFNLVDIQKYFNNYMDFKEKLEALLKRLIDLIENQAVRNPIFRKVLDREKKLVYKRKMLAYPN
jgi:predicted nucleotidyltransferase